MSETGLVTRYATDAAHAHTNLTIFHAIINMLEGGVLYGPRPQRKAAQIVRLCKAAAQTELAAMDRATSALRAARKKGSRDA